MLPFESKQLIPGERSDFAQSTDLENDVKVSFEVIAVIAFFIGFATLFGLVAHVF